MIYVYIHTLPCVPFQVIMRMTPGRVRPVAVPVRAVAARPPTTAWPVVSACMYNLYQTLIDSDMVYVYNITKPQ